MRGSLEEAIPDSANLSVTAFTQYFEHKHLPFFLEGDININACTNIHIDLDVGHSHFATNDQVNAGRVAHFDLQFDLYRFPDLGIGIATEGHRGDEGSTEGEGTGWSAISTTSEGEWQ